MTLVKNIPITIDPLFLLLVLLISLFNGNFVPLHVFLWATVVVISVLFHELGHALSAQAFGLRASIKLVGFGGLTTRHGPSLKPWREFILVLNGPLASMLLAGLAWLAYQSFGNFLPEALRYLLHIMVYANIFWTLLNLLPIQPLDGGHLLRIVLVALFGVRGIKIALFLSFLFSLAIAMLLFLIGQLLLGSFFLLFTFEAYRNWQNSLPLTEQDKDANLRRLFKQAEKEFKKENDELALQHFQAVRQQANSGVLFQKATARLAEIYGRQQKFQQAYDLLSAATYSLDIGEQVLFQQVCFHLKHWKEAILIGNKVYRYQPLVDVAATNALAHGNLGEAGPAIGWIHCTIRGDKKDLASFLKRSEFDSIRRDLRFIELQKKYEP